MRKILAAISLVLLLVACKKDAQELPPATQTGADTFGAKINGEIWTTKGFGPFPANDILEGRHFSNGDVIINARNFASSPNESEFVIFVRGVTGPGVYPLNTDVSHPTFASSYAYFVKRNMTPENEWLTSSAYTGSVSITKLDTTNRIVSGTFQFNMINQYNAPQPLTVSEGRFDVKLH